MQRYTAPMSVFHLSFALALGILFSQPAFTATPKLTVTSESASQTGAVPRGAQRVPFLTLTLQASCDAAIDVTGIRIWHGGAGEPADLERIYAMEEGRRLTRSTSFSNKERSATLALRSFSVPACGKRTLTIAGDLAATAATSGEHRLTVKGSADIIAPGATVSGAGVVSGTLYTTPANRGTVEIEYRKTLSRLTYGSDRTVARILLRAKERNQELLSITLTNNGSARDSDIQNIFASLSNGEPLSLTAATLDGDTVTLLFDPPLHLNRNSEILLSIHADIRASVRRTIRLLIEEESDVVAREARSRRQ